MSLSDSQCYCDEIGPNYLLRKLGSERVFVGLHNGNEPILVANDRNLWEFTDLALARGEARNFTERTGTQIEVVSVRTQMEVTPVDPGAGDQERQDHASAGDQAPAQAPMFSPRVFTISCYAAVAIAGLIFILSGSNNPVGFYLTLAAVAILMMTGRWLAGVIRRPDPVVLEPSNEVAPTATTVAGRRHAQPAWFQAQHGTEGSTPEPPACERT